MNRSNTLWHKISLFSGAASIVLLLATSGIAQTDEKPESPSDYTPTWSTPETDLPDVSQSKEEVEAEVEAIEAEATETVEDATVIPELQPDPQNLSESDTPAEVVPDTETPANPLSESQPEKPDLSTAQ